MLLVRLQDLVHLGNNDCHYDVKGLNRFFLPNLGSSQSNTIEEQVD